LICAEFDLEALIVGREGCTSSAFIGIFLVFVIGDFVLL
jgi:hypothetical protein